MIHGKGKGSSLTNERILGASGLRRGHRERLHGPVAFAEEAPSTEQAHSSLAEVRPKRKRKRKVLAQQGE